MSFVKRLLGQAVVLIGALSAVAGAAEAQVKGKAPSPSPVIDRGPSNVDLVNKALKPGASDPNVPLPHPDLATSASGQADATSMPPIFGRQEQGGGVLGLRVPIPVERKP
jgi:hypothetical protein